MDFQNVLISVVVFLAAAVLAVPLFRRLGLSAVLGYLAAGVALGPWGARVVDDPQIVLTYSQIGVVMLLFLVGLELTPRRLWLMRHAVFGYGSAQAWLGEDQDTAWRRVEQFREHDEQVLRTQHPVYDDETKLVQSTKEVFEDLQALFEADRR